ncbi:MAG: hypothetical protein AAGE96_07785 [Cyanobacteria bacterium P01_G01_bin.19]
MINQNINYIYSFANASLTLRVAEHLRDKYRAYLNSVTVINLIDRWIVRVSLSISLPYYLAKNLRAFLDEMGVTAQLSADIINVFSDLDRGDSPVEVMNRYQVVVVAHGKPIIEEIEIFRQQIVERLGYCPQNMA